MYKIVLGYRILLLGYRVSCLLLMPLLVAPVLLLPRIPDPGSWIIYKNEIRHRRIWSMDDGQTEPGKRSPKPKIKYQYFESNELDGTNVDGSYFIHFQYIFLKPKGYHTLNTHDSESNTNIIHNMFSLATTTITAAMLLLSSSSVQSFQPTLSTLSTVSSSYSITAMFAETTTRRPFISGNWKLNPQTRDEAVQLATEIGQAVTSTSPDSDIALFVPYVFIESTMNAVQDKLMIGAEVSVVSACVLVVWLLL